MSDGLYISKARIHEIAGVLDDTIARCNKAARTADALDMPILAARSLGEAQAYKVVKRRLLWLADQPSDSLKDHEEVKKARQAGIASGTSTVLKALLSRQQQGQQ